MLLPLNTNVNYSGSKWAAGFLVLSGFPQAIPGCLHYFLPDGGAGVIAGLDLSHSRAPIEPRMGVEDIQTAAQQEK